MSIKRIFDLLPYMFEHFPKEDALAGKENGVWKKISSSDFALQAEQFSYGLLALGILPGDKIANIANNRPEWNIADMGMLQMGAIHVPIYPTISEEDYKYILNDAQAKLVFVSNEELCTKIQGILKDVPSIQGVYCYDSIPGEKHWTELLELGKKHPDPQKLESIKNKINEYDLATLVYTSGTTGKPKGVMLSHKNIVSNFLASKRLAPITPHDKALSFLPLCHTYERMLTYLYMYMGTSIYYAESIEKISENLKEVQPVIFTTVPRLLEKVYDKIVAKGKDLTGLKKVLFFWALNLGLKYELHGANGWWYETQLKLANKLIFIKWREALGGKVKVVVSGSAALQVRLARVFWAAGIPVLEGYGLSETSPVISVNNFDDDNVRFGTVGPAIDEVTVRIAPDGEILCKGPNLMMGYYNKPDLTMEVIDQEGWFHTGDIGVLEEGKFLKITDRKKEMFKTSGGKYVAPQPVENKLKESNFIEQVMVIGENEKFVSALIVPAFAHLKNYCSLKEIPFTSNEDIIKNPLIIQKLTDEVNIINKSFGHIEQIKRFELLPKEWTVESGDLTPTQKLKRKIIFEKHKALIEKIYSN
jgi:long-chain acyl-CoA synthetase